jgi:hypothetical protein
VLVRDGDVRFALQRLPWQSAETIIGPADELTRYLEWSIGKSIPLSFIDDPDPPPVALVLHYDVRAPLAREEFEVEATPEKIVLRARTVGGVYHAVYWFLEEAVGVRWLWPGETGEAVPERTEITFPVGVHREAPDYAWRAVQVQGACNKAMDINTMLHGVLGLPVSYLEEFQLWCRRNRFGGLNIADGHRWAEIAPPEVFGELHPEYYALVRGERDCRPHDGKHGNQPCLTNPDVIQLVADYACASFAARPELDAVSIALNDGGDSCECPDCQAVDEAAGSAETGAIEHFDRATSEAAERAGAPRSVTDRLFWHLQQVVDRVKERLPERLLMTQLYSHYRRPPVTHRLPPEVIGQYCVMGSAFWDDRARETEYARIREMGKVAPGLGIYEYYSQGAWPEIHRLFPQLVADTAKEYYAAGARYFATQPGTGFAANGLNLFVLGRCLWDVGIDPDAVVEDYCRSGFGPAADVVRRYLEAFAARWRETRSGQEAMAGVSRYEGFDRLYPEGFLDERRSELESAAELASGNPEVIARVEFLRKGLDYTRLLCDACRASSALLEAAGTPDFRSLEPGSLSQRERPRVRDLARKAVDAWDAYWGFVRGHMGTYVFGEFWVNYRPGIYGTADGNLKRMRELAQMSVRGEEDQ